MAKKNWSKVLKASTEPAPVRALLPPAGEQGARNPAFQPCSALGNVSPAVSPARKRPDLEAERARLEQAGAVLQGCAEKLAAARGEVLRGVEEELVTLVLNIARSVIHSELTQHPELITAQVETALARVRDDGSITVRVHPSALGFLQEARARLLESLSDTARLHFEPDASLAPDGCVVESNFRIVDARVESQLGQIEDGLKSRPAGRP